MTRARLLLHICCAPCATHVFNLLAADYAVTGCFFNPNIHPPKEHSLRRAAAQRHCREAAVPLLLPDYRPRAWFRFVEGLEAEPEGGERCARCFLMRLDETARVAAALGFDRFGTTLTISPHKDALLINRIGRESGARHGVAFHEADFKKGNGYGESCRLSRALGLYRQEYCGCIFSRMARRRGGRPSP
jgi:predicted adenine nucleotide alpha hydrolase (AANH) superfamily ATPase